MKELIAQVIKILRGWLGEQLFIRVLFFVLAAAGTLYLVSRPATSAQILAVTVWLVIALWYSWSRYGSRLGRKLSKVGLAVTIMASIAWSFCFVLYVSSSERKLDLLLRLGDALAEKGIHVDAVKKYEEALAYAQKSAQHKGELQCRCHLGECLTLLGRANEARSHLTECRSLAVQMHDVPLQARALASLGDLELQLWHTDEARRDYDESLKLYGSEDHNGEARVLCGLGDLDYILAHPDSARKHYMDARAFYAETHDKRGEAGVLPLHNAAAPLTTRNRWITVGAIGLGSILLVVHTFYEEHEEEVIRVISARAAESHERRAYEEAHKGAETRHPSYRRKKRRGH